QMAKTGIGRLESKRDKADEAARPVLKLAKRRHMIEPLSHGLDMPVEHRSVRPYSFFMGLAHNIQPAIPVQFLRAKALSYPCTEHLGASTRKHLNAGRFQTGKNIYDGCPLFFCKVG